ncbi:hypothetical protein ILUMI_24510 [Ignelater luminosus]|uniref:GPI transamidase component PIG-S n=1 Tax=Ignelater luminosus TaxID=2038154 RepID=A0A8K0G0T8_IGNLU|nr:hypothetical protein ILUMI_24510 [Ignelater luminosus]
MCHIVQSPFTYITRKNEVLESNSFLSSRWGAISILNPDKDSCKSTTYTPKLDLIMSLFKKQIRRLLQIKGNQDLDIQEFKRIRIREMVDSTRRTLKSLAQLLSEINSIVISDDVADKINEAVEYADMAEMYVEKGDIDDGLKAAKIAFKNSEAAFSDPSLLALLYFPDDQKYAVYIPLFLPVMIPVLMSVTTVRRWYMGLKKDKTKTE